MTEIATREQNGAVGAFDPYNEQILAYLGLSPRDPKSAAVVAVARRYDLDPVLKHVIIIPKGGVYITRDGYLHVAHSSGVLDGIVVEQEPTLSENGKEWTARVSVWRKDMSHPFTFPGRYPVSGTNREYAQEMALKCAESHSLRRAFNVAGLPSLDEQRAEQARANVTTGGPPTAAEYLTSTRTDQPPAAPAERFYRQADEAWQAEPVNQPATRDPEKVRRNMFAVLGDLGVKDRDDRLAVYSALKSAPIGSTDELDDADIESIVAALELIKDAPAEERVAEVGGLITDGKRIRGAS